MWMALLFTEWFTVVLFTTTVIIKNLPKGTVPMTAKGVAAIWWTHTCEVHTKTWKQDINRVACRKGWASTACTWKEQQCAASGESNTQELCIILRLKSNFRYHLRRKSRTVSQGSRTVGRESGMIYSLTSSCLAFLFLHEVSSNTKKEDSPRRNETTRAWWNSTSVMSRADCLTYSNHVQSLLLDPRWTQHIKR